MGLVIHHLENSRSFRIVWLLNELGLEYEIKTYPRINNKASPDFKKLNALGKAPILEDDGVQILESGNIAEHLMQKVNRPVSQEERMWCWYSESTLLLHALAITYARWSLADPAHAEALRVCESTMAKNVQNDLDFLEAHLLAQDEQRKSGEGLFLVGGQLSAADVMMAFSVEFTIKKNLGIEGRTWSKINAWLEQLQQRPAYIKARKEAPHEL